MANQSGIQKCFECRLTIHPGDEMQVARFGHPVDVHKQCVPGEYGYRLPRPKEDQHDNAGD